MLHTGHKLNEARFFLKKMEEHYYDHVNAALNQRQSQPTFYFYLSAFVSAARSVTWVMRSEYSHASGWDEWFKNQELTQHQKSLLKFFNDLRIQTVKIDTISLGHNVRLQDDPDVFEIDSELPNFQITLCAVDGEKETINLGKISEFTWTFSEFDGEDVMSACREYFEMLSSLVCNCERQFG